jgi:hypothetical protein
MAEALIQRLYDSEINLTVLFSSFYDGGFTVKIGDELNGFRAEDQGQRWSDAEKWLRMKAIELYPDSTFARTEMRASEKPKARKRKP